MKKSPYTSVRRFVLINMIIVPFIPFLIVIGIGYHHFSRSIENSTIASMKRIVGDHRQMISSFLDERKNDLELIVNTVSFDELTRADRLSGIFTQLQKTSSAFSDLGIFDENGLHVAYHGPYNLTGRLYRDTAWFQETIKNGVYISDVFLGYRNIPHFIIAVAGTQNDRPWIIRATVDSQRFNTLVRQVRIGKTGEAYLLNRQGVLQTDRRSGGELMQKPSETIPTPPPGDDIHTLIHGQDRAGNLPLRHGLAQEPAMAAGGTPGKIGCLSRPARLLAPGGADIADRRCMHRVGGLHPDRRHRSQNGKNRR